MKHYEERVWDLYKACMVSAIEKGLDVSSLQKWCSVMYKQAYMLTDAYYKNRRPPADYGETGVK